MNIDSYALTSYMSIERAIQHMNKALEELTDSKESAQKSVIEIYVKKCSELTQRVKDLELELKDRQAAFSRLSIKYGTVLQRERQN